MFNSNVQSDQISNKIIDFDLQSLLNLPIYVQSHGHAIIRLWACADIQIQSQIPGFMNSAVVESYFFHHLFETGIHHWPAL